jgi:hypothetical protein
MGLALMRILDTSANESKAAIYSMAYLSNALNLQIPDRGVM